MLRLRPYKPCDAVLIAEWVCDENVFFRWGGDRFGDFPISANIIDDKYRKKNGDCTEPDNFYPWTAVDENNRPVGHFIMRYIGGDPKLLRFGWVVVDRTIRGKGYGREMLFWGLKYAFDILQADRVTIGVFEDNAPARACYKKIGFSETGEFSESPHGRILELEILRT